MSVFSLWLNSLGIPVKHLSDDFRDGLVLLNVIFNIFSLFGGPILIKLWTAKLDSEYDLSWFGELVESNHETIQRVQED